MSDQDQPKHRWDDLSDAEFVKAMDEHQAKMARLGIMWEPYDAHIWRYLKAKGIKPPDAPTSNS